MHSPSKAAATKEALWTGDERRGVTSHHQIQPRRFWYQVYGLTVECEIELPELVAKEDPVPQVRICFGEVPEVLDNVITKRSSRMASDEEFFFSVDGVAKYHIARGEVITIDRRFGLEEAAPAADVRLWLLGTAFGALLHQRGLLPLHISAVNTPNGVWAFTGESGEGKSTLAGFLYRKYGYELVSDDVSVIDPKRDVPFIYPGPRRLKLWSDTLEQLDFNGFEMAQDLTNTDKFQIYLGDDGGYRPASLDALVVLESAPDGATATIERLHGIEAFNVGFRAIYRAYMMRWFKQPQQPFVEISTLCRQTRIYRFRRPRCLADFDSNLKPLINLITQGES